MPFLPPNQQRQRTEGNSNSLFQSTHKTFLLCKSLPPQPSFSSSGLTPRIPRGLFTDTSEHIRFLHFSFSAFHFVVVCALTLLVGRQEGHPACKKTEWWGAGVVICLEQGADLHMAQRMPLPLTISCFSKVQFGFTFLVPAHPGSPGQRAVKRVCVLHVVD